MHTLAEIQSRFYAAIMAEASNASAEAALLEVLEESDMRGRRRLAAYRRGIFGNLCNALVTSYPVLCRIVGLPFFREAARNYILAHPSPSGDLNDYGGHFAGFMADYPHARELPYLADVARLEWLVQATLHSAEACPADLSVLASAPPERYGDLLFELEPACARLDSPWPLADIWRVNQPDYADDMHVDFSQACRILLRRERGTVTVQTLAAAEAAFLDALRSHASLADAAALALEQQSSFDFGASLRHWIGTGLLRQASLASTKESSE